MPRVDKLNAPLLVVGLGGTGADGLLRVKSLFQQRLNPEIIGGEEQDHPPRTAFLEIDTDSTVLRKRYQGVRINQNTEWFSMRCDMNHILGDANGTRVPMYCRDWLSPVFYTDPQMRSAAIEGAGTYRQLSRLMLFNKADDLHTKLSATLHQLAACPQGAPVGERNVNVVVITGFSGGTGSGAFLDFAYLLRHAAEQQNISYTLELYVVMPDIFVNKLATGDGKKRIQYEANGFAALKELDYWMDYDSRREPNVPDEAFTVQYSDSLVVSWNSKPFDDVTLLCGSNVEGTILQNSYDIALDAVAQMLLFIMADESQRTGTDVVISNGADNSTADDTYTFQSAKSNEHAFIRAVPRDFPHLYGYRSIGAFSNLSEQHNKVVIETSTLLTDLTAFFQKPGRMPVMEGKDPEEFAEPFRTKISDLMAAFVAQTPYPAEVTDGLAPYDMQSLRNQDEELAPHKVQLPKWIKDTITEKPKWVEAIQADLLDFFKRTAAEYVRNRGPQALEVMLSDTDHGFLRWLQDRAEMYSGEKSQYANAYNAALQNASQRFVDFKGQSGIMGLLKQSGLFRDYLGFLKQAFESYQYQVFYAAAEEAVRAVRTTVATQVLEGSLAQTIRALKELEQEYTQLSADMPQSTAIPGRMESIRKDISHAYTDEHLQEQLRTDALTQISEIAVMEGLDHETAVEELHDRFTTVLNRAFFTINNATLQDELAGIATGTVQNYAATTIAPNLEIGAQVLFANHTDYHVTKGNTAFISFVSVPRNQTDVKQGIRNYITQNDKYSGSVFKNSLVDDQVFWLNVAAGLPLCAYRFLAEYERVYEQNKERPGLHLMLADDAMLVRRNERRSIKNDWTLLPSPNPFRILHTGSQPVAPELQTAWAATEHCLSEIEKSGTIAMDLSDPAKPKCSIHIYMDGGRMMGVDKMTAKVSEAIQSTSSPEDCLTKLEAIRTDHTVCKTYQIMDPHQTDQPQANHQIAIFAGKLGLDTQVADQKEQAFRELSYWILSRRPELIQVLTRQVELDGVLNAAIRKEQEEIAKRRKLAEAIRTVAEMYLFERLSNQRINILYLNDRDELETAGQRNVLFDREKYWAHEEFWANYIPLVIRMVEWYAEQDRTLEPFRSIEAKVKELFEQAKNLEDTPADNAKAKALLERTAALVKDMEDRVIDFKVNQKELPKEAYDKALFIMNEMIKTYRGLGTIFM